MKAAPAIESNDSFIIRTWARLEADTVENEAEMNRVVVGGEMEVTYSTRDHGT